MRAPQKLRKQQVAARMRATMITANEHCAKSLGANIPPKITTKPCSAPCWNLQSGVGCQALCFVSLLSKVCSELKDTVYWFNKFLHCWKSVKCCEGWTMEKRQEWWSKQLRSSLLLIPRVPSLLLKRNWTFCICNLDCRGWLWMRPCHKWKRCPAPEGLAALQGCLLRVGARAVS